MMNKFLRYLLIWMWISFGTGLGLGLAGERAERCEDVSGWWSASTVLTGAFGWPLYIGDWVGKGDRRLPCPETGDE